MLEGKLKGLLGCLDGSDGVLKLQLVGRKGGEGGLCVCGQGGGSANLRNHGIRRIGGDGAPSGAASHEGL